MSSGPERRVLPPAHVGLAADARADGFEANSRPVLEPEQYGRRVAPLDARSDRHEHRPVTDEPLRGAANREAACARRALVAREPEPRERPQRAGGACRDAEQAPPCDSRSHGLGTVSRASALRPHRPVSGYGRTRSRSPRVRLQSGACSTRSRSLPPKAPRPAPPPTAVPACASPSVSRSGTRTASSRPARRSRP